MFTPLNLKPLSLKPHKKGLALTYKVDPVGQATLWLRWGEVVLIVSFLGIGWFIVHFREQIAKWWLISQWAPSHLHETVVGITVIAAIGGLLAATWKKK